MPGQFPQSAPARPLPGLFRQFQLSGRHLFCRGHTLLRLGGYTAVEGGP